MMIFEVESKLRMSKFYDINYLTKYMLKEMYYIW